MNVRLANLIIYGAIAAILGLAGVFVTIALNRPELTETLCRKDGELPGHTVILVDLTDHLTETQVKQLSSLVEEIRKSLGRYERFSIYTITDKQEFPPGTMFSLCNPGRIDQINIATETERDHRVRYRQKFGKPLEEVLATFSEPRKENISPIMEMLGNLTSLNAFNASVPNRKLYFYSDMLQNTQELLSQYKPYPGFSEIQKTSAFREVKPDLTGVDVHIYYLPRGEADKANADSVKPHPAQNAAHRRFWIDYFNAAGVTSLNWCIITKATLNKDNSSCAQVLN